ncbi:MAG: YdcF family protein [Pontibacterium sp.]
MEIAEQVLDAVIIPGGGVAGQGELPEWTVRRLECALAYQNSRYFIALSAGTTHKPLPLDEHGHTLFESVLASRYLQKKGVAADKLLYETASYDTLGNAYFLKVIHIDPLKLKRIKIITSEFHMPRTRAIFEFIFGPCFTDQPCELSFETVSDKGLDESVLQQRRLREQQSLEQFLQRSARVTRIEQLHQWLFSEHKAYSFAEPDRREVLDKRVLASY